VVEFQSSGFRSVGVHVCPSSSAISDCNRLVMDANVPNSVRSATDNCDACFL
jgi:hypothetical protein